VVKLPLELAMLDFVEIQLGLALHLENGVMLKDLASVLLIEIISLH
jgi:hypothetical protein